MRGVLILFWGPSLRFHGRYNVRSRVSRELARASLRCRPQVTSTLLLSPSSRQPGVPGIGCQLALDLVRDSPVLLSSAGLTCPLQAAGGCELRAVCAHDINPPRRMLASVRLWDVGRHIAATNRHEQSTNRAETRLPRGQAATSSPQSSVASCSCDN